MQTDSPRAEERTARATASDELRAAHASGKRQFVEPEVSAPVNVLEATTFFQAATSGGTN